MPPKKMLTMKNGVLAHFSMLSGCCGFHIQHFEQQTCMQCVCSAEFSRKQCLGMARVAEKRKVNGGGRWGSQPQWARVECWLPLACGWGGAHTTILYYIRGWGWGLG